VRVKVRAMRLDEAAEGGLVVATGRVHRYRFDAGSGTHAHPLRPAARRRLTGAGDFRRRRQSKRQEMSAAVANPVVHLELRTDNVPRACAFYTRLFGWSTETIHANGSSYLALELGEGILGGAVEHDSERPAWLPYVEVADIAEATRRGRLLGAAVLLEPREGPAGWRSVLAAPAGAEIALWQPKL
jgi:predicted enzyme related to lactoylglutathione lyase